MKREGKSLFVIGPIALAFLFVGCVGKFGVHWRSDVEAKARKMCIAVNDYAATHGDLDKRIQSRLNSIRMENFVIRKDRESFSFGDEWCFEPKSNRLYNPGYRVGRELTEFTINFANVGNSPVAIDMNMRRPRFIQ